MRLHLRRTAALLLVAALVAPLSSSGSAYNARPKLLLIIVVDQMRGDFLDRYAHRFGEGGFRLFLDRGAVFTDARYEHANPRTSVGHATIVSGAYIPGHGVIDNEFWDHERRMRVGSVWDPDVTTVGPAPAGKGSASPHRLTASTLGDELKLATGGRARVYSTSLKDTAAAVSGGRGADAAFWIARASGAWVSSTWYMKELPAWVTEFNAGRRAEKYWNLEWKDAEGKVLRTTQERKRPDGTREDFYRVVGTTPYGNDYQLEFARELIEREKLGAGPVTDMLVISLSANDNLGHEVGPYHPAMEEMAAALDRQLAEFFSYLGRQIGLADTWIVLTSDHGVSPLPRDAQALRLGGRHLTKEEMRKRANQELSRQLTPGRFTEFVAGAGEWPFAYLSQEAFAAVNLSEEEAGRAAGEAMMRVAGWRSYLTRPQLARGELPGDPLSRRYANVYTPHRGWYIVGMVDPYTIGWPGGTDHSLPLSYDLHVPMAFYGLPFQPGLHRGPAEVVDIAATLASLLGVGRPTHCVGRVLTEALAPPPEKAR